MNCSQLNSKILLLFVSFFLGTNITYCQNPDPNASIWGLYASGIGERLTTCMDPCWITYTVAMTTDRNIVSNLEYGTMAAVSTNITWHEATALQRRYGRYFDDEPDGTWKCSPCDVPKPDLSCPWGSTSISL